MKEREETILLRKIVEDEDLNPVPNRIVFSEPHYEIIVPIGADNTASIYLSRDAYFALVETEEYVN